MFKENDIVVATTGSPTKVRVIEDQINSELFSGIVIYDDSSPAGFDKDYFSDNWYSPSFKLEK